MLVVLVAYVSLIHYKNILITGLMCGVIQCV